MMLPSLGIFITRHAIERWIERVDNKATPAKAKAAILSHAAAIHHAARFGAQCVKLGDGTRLRVDGTTVVTVIGNGH